MCGLAAIAGGLDPERYTYAELREMAEEADRAKWARTQAVLAQIHNANCTDSAATIDPMIFFPWDKGEPDRAPPMTDADRDMFRKVYGKGGE